MRCSEAKFKVFVKCITYNQSSYITDALNGFVMQQTDFPFICVIVDDASTDGEQEILKKYFQSNFELSKHGETNDYILAFGQHKTNKNCYFAVLYLKYNHYAKKTKTQYYSHWQNQSKYIALCEGDDYWTDEKKIQRQADFLDDNMDCSLTSENGFVIYTSSGKTRPFSNENSTIYSIDDLLIRRRFPTASVMYRAKYSEELSKNKCDIDTIVWAYLSSKGKIHYNNNIISSVYRRGPGVTENDKVRWAYMSEDFNKRINEMFNPSAKVRLIRRKLMFIVYVRGVSDSIRRFLLGDFFRLLWHLFGCFFSLVVDTMRYFYEKINNEIAPFHKQRLSDRSQS